MIRREEATKKRLEALSEVKNLRLQQLTGKNLSLENALRVGSQRHQATRALCIQDILPLTDAPHVAGKVLGRNAARWQGRPK